MVLGAQVNVTVVQGIHVIVYLENAVAICAIVELAVIHVKNIICNGT